MFEYKLIQANDEGWFRTKFDWQEVQNTLNKLGKEGWELVNAVDVNASHGGSQEIVFVLKRRIE